MLVQLPNYDPARFLKQIETADERLSEDERIALFVQLFKGTASNYRSPGVEQLGRVRMRAFGYFRNSAGRLEESTSIPRQLEKFLDYCKCNNLSPSGVFADPDTSGVTVLQRPGLMRLLIEVRIGNVDVIVAESPDRIGRAMSSIGLTWDAIRRHRVPLINLHDGQALTDQTVMIYGFMAANEHARIAARTKDGSRRRARDKDSITKPLAYGHFREYPRGPVKIHPVRSQIVLETYRMYLGGLCENQIATMWNEKWLGGQAEYEPPHREAFNEKGTPLIWRPTHLVTNKPSMSGILENVQCMGIFTNSRGQFDSDPLNGKVTITYPHPHPDPPVVNQELGYVSKVMYDMAQERRIRRYDARLAERAKKDDHGQAQDGLSAAANAKPEQDPSTKIGSAGKRPLLSGVLGCGLCGYSYSFMRWLGETVLYCGGIRSCACTSHMHINMAKVQNALVDAFQQEISSSGALGIYIEARKREFELLIDTIKGSKGELEARLEQLVIDLEETTTRKENAKSARAREHYAKQEEEIDIEMKQIEDKLAAADDAAPMTPLRLHDAMRARELLERLRDPEIGLSGNSNDIWISQRFRTVVSGVIHPNAHDYGAVIRGELDFSSFFQNTTITGREREAKCRFVVSIPPKGSRPRQPPRSDVDNKMIERWEEYPLSDALWHDIETLLQPYLRFPRQRKHYQVFLVNLRAGGSPSTDSAPFKSTRRVMLAFREHGIWPSFEAILRKHGEDWIDNLNPGYAAYLSGTGGNPNDEWKVTILDD